jgi:hypothetical protein
VHCFRSLPCALNLQQDLQHRAIARIPEGPTCTRGLPNASANSGSAMIFWSTCIAHTRQRCLIYLHVKQGQSAICHWFQSCAQRPAAPKRSVPRANPAQRNERVHWKDTPVEEHRGGGSRKPAMGLGGRRRSQRGERPRARASHLVRRHADRIQLGLELVVVHLQVRHHVAHGGVHCLHGPTRAPSKERRHKRRFSPPASLWPS